MQLSTKPGDAGNGEANQPKERTAHQLRDAIPKTTSPQMDRSAKIQLQSRDQASRQGARRSLRELVCN